MARFRSTAIFSPWASVLFRFAGLPLGFPSLFPLGRQVFSLCFFWCALALLLCALARLVFLLRFFLFPPCSVAGNRWCLGRRKNAFAPPPSRARVMRPRIWCFE